MDVPTTVKNKELVEKRREQIVLAAIALFSQKGFHKTTLRDLAEKAGISTGNIYDYIGSKEDIFFLIHDFAADLAMETLNQAVRGVSDPIEKLRRMVRAEFNLMDEWSDAIMLVYQESHILSSKFLHKLLARERDHVGKFEEVIDECVRQKRLSTSNSRIAANLIKSMVDTWIIKRWDLRGHATRGEAEAAILDLVFDGLHEDIGNHGGEFSARSSLSGKTALLANTDTILASAVLCELMISGVHAVTIGKKPPNKDVIPDLSNHLHHFSRDKNGHTPYELIDEIERQYGTFDFYVHDLGIGNTKLDFSDVEDLESGSQLESNLRWAQDTSQYITGKMSEHGTGKVVFIAPWEWDRHANRLRFETASGAARGLVRALAEDSAPAGVNVNLVVPGYIRQPRPSPLEKSLEGKQLSRIPFHRMGELEDVVHAVMFLLGDLSCYITGEVIQVNGGLRLKSERGSNV